MLSHNTHLIGNVFTILWFLLGFFFLKKKLEHIKNFFFVSVNIVINLFVSILWLFASFFKKN